MCYPIQHYAWGSKCALTTLYRIDTPNSRAWDGRPPKSGSRILDKNNDVVSLRGWLAQDLSGRVGHQIAYPLWRTAFPVQRALCGTALSDTHQSLRDKHTLSITLLLALLMSSFNKP